VGTGINVLTITQAQSLNMVGDDVMQAIELLTEVLQTHKSWKRNSGSGSTNRMLPAVPGRALTRSHNTWRRDVTHMEEVRRSTARSNTYLMTSQCSNEA